MPSLMLSSTPTPVLVSDVELIKKLGAALMMSRNGGPADPVLNINKLLHWISDRISESSMHDAIIQAINHQRLSYALVFARRELIYASSEQIQQFAFNLVSDPREDIQSLYIELLYLFLEQDADGLILNNFLRNLIMMDNLDLILSERLLSRFARRMEKIRRSTEDEVQEMILNTFIEFAMLSSGMIVPRVFEINHISPGTAVYEITRRALSQANIELQSLLHRFSSSTSGFLLFDRYSSARVITTRLTNTDIQSLIATTARRDRVQVLETMYYKQFSDNIRNNRLKLSSREFTREVTNELVRIFSTIEFQEKFGWLVRAWLPKLENLLGSRKT